MVRLHYDLERVEATQGQIHALFALLKQRDFGISHVTMPDFEDHAEFVRTHPYRVWYLVRVNNTYSGSVYITEQNTIGLNLLADVIEHILQPLLRDLCSRHAPLPPIRSIRAAHYAVNTAPTDTTLQSALKEAGFEIAQITFRVTDRES